MGNEKGQRRTYREIRERLLYSLALGQQTIRSLSQSAGVNWDTTRNHLIYLMGKEWARQVLALPYVRIYEITEKGRNCINLQKY
ncbi:hypothetical protein COY95_02205 [Candidatus Woesearchaeota archaeon CG_4_10_14_0_8_um_filter_47_5]|nr:MAG: hypothetical protein COY95_02205 [Candidatus Woesearchaeota archaeon CG_4_10_14_0_8_um_filter_47_5]